MTALQERSGKIIDIWNRAVILRSRIKFFPYMREEEAEKWQDRIDKLKFELDGVCGNLKPYQLEQQVYSADVARAESRTWIDYIVEPGITFETLCANIKPLLVEGELAVKDYEFIGEDEKTGDDIFYSMENEEYILADKETGKEIARSDSIEIDETISLDTETGKDVPLVAEATSMVTIKGKGKEEIQNIEDDIQTSLENYLKDDLKFHIKSNARKKGVSYKFGGTAKQYPRMEVFAEKIQPRYSKFKPEVINI